MTALVPRTVKGLDFSGSEALLIEPTFDDPVDVSDPGSVHVEGDNVKTTPATTSGFGKVRWSSLLDFVLLSHADQKEFYATQEYRHGRTRPFWLPSWRADFNPLTDVVPTNRDIVFVQDNGTDWIYEANRYGLMIRSVGNIFDFFRIVGFHADRNALQLSGTIDYAIRLQDIELMSLVRRCRGDQDEVDWEFLSDAVVRLGLKVIEVFNEGGLA